MTILIIYYIVHILHVILGSILFEVFTGSPLLFKYREDHIKEHLLYNEAVFFSDMKKVYNEVTAFECYIQESLVGARKHEFDPDKEALMDLIIQLLRVNRKDRIKWDSFVCHPYINPHVGVFI